MARRPRTEPVVQAEINPLAAVYSSFDPARVGTGTSVVTLSNNNLTASATATATAIATAATTPGDNTSVYFEVRVTNFPSGNGANIGLVNTNFNVNGTTPGGDANSIGYNQYGNVYINNVQIGTTGPTYASGDWLGVAVNFPNKTIQVRNITQNSAWSPTYSFASITPTPFFFATGFNTSAAPLQTTTVNFDGTFLGTAPSGGYARWHTAPTSPMTGPRDTFSEQPATVITVDALIANGSYTASGPTDRVNLPFSVVQFGAATLDTNNNLQFQDVVIDDPPLLAITLQVAGPATVTIYGQWDYSGTWFVITTVNIPTSTAVTVTNIPILPPNYPQWGQGDILQLSLTCSTTALFTWSNGHVYGIETVPIFPVVEGAPVPPSVLGQQLINRIYSTTVQAQFTNTTATTAGTVVHIPISSIFSGTGATVNANNDLVITAAGATTVQMIGVLQQPSITTPSNNSASIVYSINGGPYQPFYTSNNLYSNTQNNFTADKTITFKAGDVISFGLVTNVSTSTQLTYAQIGIFDPELSFFSAAPIVPPPLIGMGGGAPPTFPPPTPPPIGAIPPGVLVGPAIAAAAVPPSNAGKALIIFTYGSATTPPASAAFPEFTTTFPNPPIVFSNIFTDGVSPTTPPSTASTLCITLSNNWGPPIGPALPPVVPPRQFMVATNGDPADVVTVASSDNNGEVYDDRDEENEDWVEDSPHRPPETPKPRRGRGRRR